MYLLKNHVQNNKDKTFYINISHIIISLGENKSIGSLTINSNKS